ncbi:MAG: 2-hydroxyglutaryl-CoA dehydratase [Clostridiales bacterium]|nr:2-hydroxyglutaryl-CoA dehydratase [Clostridiales bacterium]
MNPEKRYLGIDVGSVSINLVMIDEEQQVIDKLYVRTEGKPIPILKKAMEEVVTRNIGNYNIGGVGVTGSGRDLAAAMVGSDVVKNEITAHGVAVLSVIPQAGTVIEIGGQDSKIILIRNGVVSDFAMNTVCAAGTGSFLDRQAARLNIPIGEFGRMALKSKKPVRIAGRCAVFAESDMVHKQQMGCPPEDIVRGLCQALVRNYLSNVGKGKEILPAIVFQGGVAANRGIQVAFEEALGHEVIIPANYDVMGAVGSAILAQKEVKKKGNTNFRGIENIRQDFMAKAFECNGCPNACEIVELSANNHILARWGDRCGKWAVKREGRPEHEYKETAVKY